MNIKKRYDKGVRRQIAEIICLCGVVPDKSLRYLHEWNYRWAREKINEMIKEEYLLYLHRAPKPRVITFDANDDITNKIINVLPEQLCLLWQSYTKEDRHKYISADDKIKVSRIYLNADANLFVYGIGINVIPDSKYAITDKRLGDACYYTSREIKQGLRYTADVIKVGDDVKIANSKLRGLLMSDGGDYGVYRLDSRSDFSKNGEYKMKVTLERAVKRKRNGNAEYERSIIIADENKKEILPSIMDPDIDDGRYTYTNMENVYQYIYGLPASVEGQMVLKLMTKKNWQMEMLANFGMPVTPPSINVICDDYRDGIFYLLFCIPDVKRLRKFITRAELQEERDKFVVVCFDFQVDMLRKATKNRVKIKSIPLLQYLEKTGNEIYEEFS